MVGQRINDIHFYYAPSPETMLGETRKFKFLKNERLITALYVFYLYIVVHTFFGDNQYKLM